MQALLISTTRHDEDVPAALPADEHCVYCGQLIGDHAQEPLSCVLCHLVRHIDRPSIDCEARLVWLPEMSQTALVLLVREIHVRLRAGGETLTGGASPAVATPERSAVHYVLAALTGRCDLVSEHLGTGRPSELAQILAGLPLAAYARRRQLFAGLRLLPAGRFLVGSTDVYPAIVDSWRKPPPAAAERPARSAT